MNIWSWIIKLQNDLAEAGQGQAAKAIDQFSHLVCELEIERAEALLPEILALSKTLDNPWLTVWARHWEMRNRIGNRSEGQTALADVVALFEFAHRQDTMSCPQSICATQDLAACHANIDGPGTVVERIKVCDETLARIDPSWGCFSCLSCEKAAAILDDGRLEDALAWLNAQEKAIIAKGEEPSGFSDARASVLLKMERAAEALNEIEEAQDKAQSDGYDPAQDSQLRLVRKALALAQLGRDDQAQETLPSWDELAPTNRMEWLRTMHLLLQRAAEDNTWHVGRQVQQTVDHFAAVGAHRSVIEAAGLGIDLALARGSPWSARRLLEVAQRHQPQLRQDRGASAQLALLSAKIDKAPAPPPMPAPAAQLIEWLAEHIENEARDPEREVQWLLQAVGQSPDDVALREAAANALSACAAKGQAIALLWEDVLAHSSEERDTSFVLLKMLLEEGDTTQMHRLASLYREGVPELAFWCEAKCAEQLGDWPEVERQCRAVLGLTPQARGARHTLALSLTKQKRFADAALELQTLIDMIEEGELQPTLLWDHMSAASSCGDWAAVRRSARALDLDLDGQEGPVEEEVGLVNIRFEEGGDERDYLALCTGPVTARIQELAPGNQTQHAGDWVVFDAAPIEPEPEDEEERENFIHTFRLYHLLEAGGFAPSWTVDGVHPGQEPFNAFRDRARDRGWRVWVLSGERYRVEDSQEGDTDLPGIYFLIAQPEGQSPQELHLFLEDACRHWPHRWSWLPLAKACGQPTQPHLDQIARYGL